MNQAKLLKFGNGGHVIYFLNPPYKNCTCSGYEDPETFVKPYHWWAHPKDQISRHWDGYVFPPDGLPVIDLREAVETDPGYSWVFKSPMVNPDLPEGAVERLDNRDGPPRSLDCVSVSEYVRGWREHGAKIGKAFIRDGACIIEWETTDITAEQAAELNWSKSSPARS